MVYCKTRVGVVLLVVFATCFAEMDLVSYILVAFYTCGYTYRYITWVWQFATQFGIQRATENVNAAQSKANMLHLQRYTDLIRNRGRRTGRVLRDRASSGCI